MKSFKAERQIQNDRIKRKTRTSRHHNFARSRETNSFVTRSMAHLLVLVAPVMVLAWTMFPLMPTPNPLSLFPVVAALPDVKRTSSLASTIKGAVQKKAKGKIDESLRKTKRKDSNFDTNNIRKGKENTSNDPNSIESRVRIESFLAPRRFPLRTFLRTAFLLLAARSFLECLRTSGIPYAQTVWQIVYGMSNEGANSGAMLDKPAAASVVPTSIESKLAQMILSTSNDFNVMLPPTILPSAGPLLKFFLSIVAYVGLTLLLPRWSTKFRVLLDYRQFRHPSKSDDEQSLKDQKAQDKDISVLVRVGIPSETCNAKKLSSNLQIIPLQQSSKSTTTKEKSKMKSKSKTKQSKRTSEGKNEKTDDDESADYLHPSDYYFDIDHSRIYCDLDDKDCIDGAPSLQTAPFSAIKRIIEGGGLTNKQRRIAQERYEPYNTFPLASPTFQEAFLERISAPLVVIQFVGRLVSLLEEGKGALFSFLMILAQHYYNAQQAIVSAKTLAEEVKTNLQDTSGYQVSLWKESKQKWLSTTAGELVPGDLFRLTMDQGRDRHDADKGSNKPGKRQELIVPVDALVIKGQCLTNEAILTGESVPQIKIPLDFTEETTEEKRIRDDIDSNDIPSERRLDLHKDRSSILFAGTTMFHTIGGGNPENAIDTKDSTAGGVLCIALRTGTYSSKGRLLKALKGKAHVGAISNEQSEKDAIRMIASLSCCAVLSCLSLFVRRNANAGTVSPFRRVIQCTRIALASIPSDLPLALASIARYCSKILRHDSDVVCSEPGSLLTAAYIDTVVFDKTGTLTADTQSLSKVVRIKSQSKSDADESFQRFVLAGCHSLVHFEENGGLTVVGDPLDQAALQFSNWKYDQTGDFFSKPEGDMKSLPASEPVRLWQIRNFPFDPSRRLSSAIVLLQRKDSSLELYKLTKGSPDTIIDLIQKDSNSFELEFRNRTQELEMQGYRCIALGAENLGGSQIAHAMFPNGLSSNTDALAQARAKAETLQRDAIDRYDPEKGYSALDFCGFCCFDASTRRSSKRVVNELLCGGLKCIMLTGDSVDAALSVARKVDIFKKRKIAVLERSEDSSTRNEKLVWKILQSKIAKDGTLRILHHRTKVEEVTFSSATKFIEYHRKGKYSLAANGRALELILFDKPNKVRQLIAENLAKMSVIARATPELKKQVIETLKQDCGKRVMMCGDGVNDVAAIQSADVAASLLTGFGSEKSESKIDIDDERRMKRLATMNIGSNRSENVGKAKKQEANDRIRKEIEKYRTEIDNRVSSRVSTGSESAETEYTFEDMKDMISATMRAAKKERQRAQQLRRGGGDAARILAKERKLLTSLEDEDGGDESSSPSIKPGEASLVSSFSCLHPSVDGIDGILREGVATAASTLATQQSIGLHSLMSCFHLATLYRDGFRYGDHMWNVEIFFYQILENARNRASCTPRPRLPSSVLDRPPASLFQFSSIFGVLSQAIIHIACMALGVRYGKHLEKNLRNTTSEQRIRLESVLGSNSIKLEKLLETLAKRSELGVTEGDRKSFSFFQRPPFRPTYETNVVFLLSILQSAISALVSHKGAPFYHSVLESRDLCVISGATLVFVMVCITGKISTITNFLQLKPLPSKFAKLVFLGIVMVNIITCIFCRVLMDHLFSVNGVARSNTSKSDQTQTKNAADHEEKLLSEETEYNMRSARFFSAVVAYFTIDVLVSSK